MRQLYRHQQPFVAAFPWAYARAVALAERVGRAIGLEASELARVRNALAAMREWEDRTAGAFQACTHAYRTCTRTCACAH